MNEAEPDPTEFPSDETFSKWLNRYGTTGVKTASLDGRNRGCIAVYREMSMSERQVAARVSKMDEESPGSYDPMRMLVSTCLLHPTLDSYPVPYQAAMSLFSEIKQSGHGPKSDQENMIGPEGQQTSLPEHMVEEIAGARAAAKKAFEDPEFASVYKNIIVELAQNGDPQEGLDPQTFDYLWRLPIGRLRDVAATLEQANLEIRKSAYEALENSSDLSSEQREERSKQIDLAHPNPWAQIDNMTGGATVPGSENESSEQQQEKRKQPEKKGPEDPGVAPNQPSREVDTEALKEELRG